MNREQFRALKLNEGDMIVVKRVMEDDSFKTSKAEFVEKGESYIWFIENHQEIGQHYTEIELSKEGEIKF